MQPAAIQNRVQGAKPLGKLFNAFKRYAEATFSAGSSLKHIEDAANPQMTNLVEQDTIDASSWEELRQKDWIARKHEADRDKVVLGLAIYLFDRFIRDDMGAIRNVFLRLPEEDNHTLGDLALTFVGEHPFVRRHKFVDDNGHVSEHTFGRIDFRSHASKVRLRLIETAEGFSGRYRFVDTELWEISGDTQWFLSIDDEDLEMAQEVWSHIGPHVGAALFFDGDLPNEKQISKIMGKAQRFSEEHIQELVGEIHQMTVFTPLEKLFQVEVAARLGVPKNSRTFQNKIWARFRSELSEEERNRLPKRGDHAEKRK